MRNNTYTASNGGQDVFRNAFNHLQCIQERPAVHVLLLKYIQPQRRNQGDESCRSTGNEGRNHSANEIQDDLKYETFPSITNELMSSD